MDTPVSLRPVAMKRYHLYIYCLLLLLPATACSKKYHVVQYQHKVYKVSSSDGVDSNYANMLQPYKQAMDSQMNVVIGIADTSLHKGQPECTLGNFIADAMLLKAKEINTEVIASIANYGGIRVPYISAGNVTVRKMYELMPFDNTLTLLDIPGTILQQFCNHMAAAEGWPVSNISYTIQNKTATHVLINGQPIDLNKTYKIATNDYLATGGDNCSFLVTLNRSNTNIPVRDILIAYVQMLAKANKPLHPYIEKRVAYAE